MIKLTEYFQQNKTEVFTTFLSMKRTKCFVLKCKICFVVLTGTSQAAASASIVNNVAISRTFQILYRNEDLNVNDAILYRIHTLVDSSRVSCCFVFGIVPRLELYSSPKT